MERVAGREPRHGTRNAVTLSVLFELQDAASLGREPCEPRAVVAEVQRFLGKDATQNAS